MGLPNSVNSNEFSRGENLNDLVIQKIALLKKTTKKTKTQHFRNPKAVQKKWKVVFISEKGKKENNIWEAENIARIIGILPNS